MTVSAQSPLNSYAANGVTTVFAFSFMLLAAADLVVQVVDASGGVTTKTLGVDYAVAGVGVGSGGTITFGAAPANGYTVRIYRDSDLERDTDYQSNGDLLSRTLNVDFDRIWLVLQELIIGSKAAQNALRAPVGESLPEIAGLVARKDRLLGFNSGTGLPEMSSFTITQIASIVGAIYAAAAGPLDALSFIQAGAGALSRTAQDKAREIFSVKDFGAAGDGVTDDTTKCQAAMTAGAGKTVLFPPGDYRITAALRVPANTCVMGAGYGSRILCPDAGWLLGTTDNFGLLNVKGVDNVRITNLRLYGTKVADNAHSPKLVYFETANDLSIDHCWLENSAWEGIWSGGVASASRRIIIAHNHVNSVGQPAGAFVGLPAIQPNGYDIIILGNELYDVGSGIGPSGTNVVIANNFIRNFTVVGISTGDGGAYGNTSIIGNVIEFSAAVVARSAILLAGGGGTVGHINCSNNTIRVFGTAGLGNGRGIRTSTAQSFTIANNTIDIDVRGVGVEVTGLAAGVIANLSDNIVRVTNEGGACTCFGGTPNGAGNTLTLFSSGNRVYGATRANGSYSFDYTDGGGGTLNATCSGDFMSEGNFRLGGGVNYAVGQVDNKPIFMRNDLTKASAYLAAPQVGTLNFSPASGVSIAAGVITLAGAVAGLDQRRSRVTVDTEGGAGADDLDTINGTQDGDWIVVKAANSARTVVMKDGTGNMKLAGDFSMDNAEDRIVLINDGGTLYELSRSDNGA